MSVLEILFWIGFFTSAVCCGLLLGIETWQETFTDAEKERTP